MRQRAWIILILISLGLAFAAWQLLRPREPSYRGKTLSEWLSPTESPKTLSADFVQWEDLKDALQAMGEEAVPLLTERLRWKPTLSILALSRRFPKIQFLGELADRARSRDPRTAAAYALGLLGPKARIALPELETLFANQSDPFYLSYMSTVGFALASIRQDPLTPYIEKLRDPTKPEWWDAIGIVPLFGTNAVAAIPHLIAALETNGNSRDVRRLACQALAYIHSRPELCVPALARLLESPDTNLRSMSIFALTAFGSSATSAWPKIVECLQDPDPWIRGATTNLLKTIDPDAAAGVGVR